MNKFLIGLVLSLTASTLVYAAGDAAAGKEKAASCGGCHGVDGNSALGLFPKIAGQNVKYLMNQLTAIKYGKRVVVEMTGQLDNKNEQDLEDLAAYYASQTIVGGKTAADQFELGQKNIPCRYTGQASCRLHGVSRCKRAGARFSRFSYVRWSAQ